MIDFEQRWNAALERIRYSPSGMKNNYASRIALASAFAKSTFIYGTVGPNTLNRGGNTGNPVARAAQKLSGLASENEASEHHGRKFNLYDPGARTAQLVKGGLQMMDMYYGMDNQIFENRDPSIAEFVHCVMEFDKMGVAFSKSISGRDSFKMAFPSADEGWHADGPEQSVYGQSATREMSKIIREGIKRFGGKLIFEGKHVFGNSLFNPAAFRQGDTDLEAQELFKYFNKPKVAGSKFGNGTLEFHWGGKPTAPTRAHFLTNWSFADRFKTHQPVNFRHSQNEYVLDVKDLSWKAFITKVTEPHHGLRPIWNNFDNFPFEKSPPKPNAINQRGVMTLVEKMMCAICIIAGDLRVIEHPAPTAGYNRATWNGDQRPVGRRGGKR